MDKILESGISQQSTFQTFWDKKDKLGLNLNTCLAELIDNSISSFIQNRSKNDNLLEINIKSICHIDGLHQMIIIDNAFGMDQEEIKNAMIISKNIENKKNSSFNQYGIGLKDSIFWIGNDAQIITKKDNKTYKLTFNPLDKYSRKPSDIFRYDIKELIEDFDVYHRGTKILIDCWEKKSSRYFTKQDSKKFIEVCDFLGKKYKNYINGVDGWKLNIKLSYIDKNNQSSSSTFHNHLVEARDFNSSPLTIEKYQPNNKTIEEFIEDLKNKANQKINELGSNSLFSKLFSKFINGEEIRWTDYILLKENFDNPNEIGKKMKVNFSLLDDSCKEKSGLIISHEKRYIHFPTKEEEGIHTAYDYLENNRSFKSHDGWLIMELAIEDIEGNEQCKYIYPDHNKVRLIFSEENEQYSEKVFKKSIQKYFVRNIDNFIEFMISLKNEFKTYQSTKENAKKYYENGNPESIANRTSKYNNENGSINFDGENGYKFEVSIIEDETNDLIFIPENLDKKEEKIKYIQINKGSKYIKKDDILSIELLLLYLFLKIKQDEIGENWIGNESNINNLILEIQKWKK